MLTFGFVLGLLGSLSAVSACADGADGHTHDHSRRTVPVPVSPPTRPLVWGDLNIIHTTDSHGWLLGHQKTSFPEPNYRCVSSSPLFDMDANRAYEHSQRDLWRLRVVRDPYEGDSAGKSGFDRIKDQQAKLRLLGRSAMWTYSLSTLVTSMTVSFVVR